MSSTQEVVLHSTHLEERTRRRSSKQTKMQRRGSTSSWDESKLAFSRWEDVAEPWNFGNCKAYIEWCHIFREFPHFRYKLYCKADKANFHHYKWHVFKEWYVEMCQHVYYTPFLDATNASSPFCEWCMPR